MHFFEMKLSFEIDFQESNHLVKNEMRKKLLSALAIKNHLILMKYFRNYVALGCMQIYL